MSRALAAFIIALAVTSALPAYAAGPDRYTAIAQRVIALKSSEMGRVRTIGESVLGRPIYSIVITNPDNPDTMDSERVRVMFICGQHGDESSSVTAMTALAEDLSKGRNPQQRAMLSNAVITIVPVCNPDGFTAFQRTNAMGIDLNRDWAAPNQPETIAIARLVADFRPQVVIDEHEWLDGGPTRKTGVELAGFGQAQQYRLARMLATVIRKKMGQNGTPIGAVQYRPQANPTLAHRRFADSGICSMLIETTPDLSPSARTTVYRSFAKNLLSALTSPPNSRIADSLGSLANSGRKPRISLAALYSPSPTIAVPDFAQPIALTALACVLALAVGLRSKSKRDETDNPRAKPCTPVTELLELEASTRQKVALLRLCRRRPTDRQDTLRKPLKNPGVLIDPSENRVAGVQWETSIRRESTRPRLPSDQQRLLSDRTLARHLASPDMKPA